MEPSSVSGGMAFSGGNVQGRELLMPEQRADLYEVT